MPCPSLFPSPCHRRRGPARGSRLAALASPDPEAEVKRWVGLEVRRCRMGRLRVRVCVCVLETLAPLSRLRRRACCGEAVEQAPWVPG